MLQKIVSINNDGDCTERWIDLGIGRGVIMHGEMRVEFSEEIMCKNESIEKESGAGFSPLLYGKRSNS